MRDQGGHGGKILELKARRGVIFGSGGFEQNQTLREKFLPQPTKAGWSATPPGNNTGAALEAGLNIGAATALMDWAWWAPTIAVPGEENPAACLPSVRFRGHCGQQPGPSLCERSCAVS